LPWSEAPTTTTLRSAADQPDRDGPARLARRGLVLQGVHVRRRSPGGIVTPATLVNDQTGVIGGYSFSDWDGKHEGYIPLRTALAESRNLPALWTYSAAGGDRVVSFMHNLGVTAQIENPEGVATTLGHDALSMSEHLAAYSAFDNGGYRVRPHAVLRITDASGKVLEALDASFGRAQVIGAELAYVMTDLLRGP